MAPSAAPAVAPSAAPPMDIYSLPALPAVWDGVGIFYITFTAVWTALLLAGIAYLVANRASPVLRVRGIAVPDTARERILAQKDPERLERWLEKAIVGVSLADVLDEPS